MYPYDLFLNKAFQRHTLDFDTQNEELSGSVMADMLYIELISLTK